ncbi:hypothetical protein ACFX12_010006 [Malus domestica]
MNRTRVREAFKDLKKYLKANYQKSWGINYLYSTVQKLSSIRKLATRNSKANYGDNYYNLEAQVIPSDERNHLHDILFRPIQMRDDKGVDTGGHKVFQRTHQLNSKGAPGVDEHQKDALGSKFCPHCPRRFYIGATCTSS